MASLARVTHTKFPPIWQGQYFYVLDNKNSQNQGNEKILGFRHFEDWSINEQYHRHTSPQFLRFISFQRRLIKGRYQIYQIISHSTFAFNLDKWKICLNSVDVMLWAGEWIEWQIGLVLIFLFERHRPQLWVMSSPVQLATTAPDSNLSRISVWLYL